MRINAKDTTMKAVQQEIDERTNLTSTNKFRLLLLFRLVSTARWASPSCSGSTFKIREIVAMPSITRIAAPRRIRWGGQPARPGDSGAGLASIVGCKPQTGLNIMLVTEYARTTQAFAVESVEDIVRLDWNKCSPLKPAAPLALVTSIARLDGNTDESRRPRCWTWKPSCRWCRHRTATK